MLQRMLFSSRDRWVQSAAIMIAATATAVAVFVPGAPAVPETNLALGKPTIASNIYGSAAPARAVDGDVTTAWNAGGYPTQWIEIDLGSDLSLVSARLKVSQNPPGFTFHEIIGRTSSGAIVPLASMTGYTQKNQWLSPAFLGGTPVRYVRVKTIASPSWVAWFEIELFGQTPLSIAETPWSRIKALYRN